MKRKKKQVNVVWEFFYSGNKKIKHWVQKKLTETSTGDPCPNISALQLLFCSKICFYD